MQSTGYRDRKGREIFEGDACWIIFWHLPQKEPVVGVVRPYPGPKWHCQFAIYVPGEELPYSVHYKTGGSCGNRFAVEVIGNVAENPELVE